MCLCPSIKVLSTRQPFLIPKSFFLSFFFCPLLPPLTDSIFFHMSCVDIRLLCHCLGCIQELNIYTYIKSYKYIEKHRLFETKYHLLCRYIYNVTFYVCMSIRRC